MAELHRRLCPGLVHSELLTNPIRSLRTRLENVDFSGVSWEKPAEKQSSAEGTSSIVTPSERYQQIITQLEAAEKRFENPSAIANPLEELSQWEFQAETAYLNEDWKNAAEAYTKIIESPVATPTQIAKALFSRAYSYSRQGKIGEDIKDYSRAIELEGAPMELVARALFNRGVRYGEQGKTGEEIGDYTRAIELKCVPAELVARALFSRGVCYEQHGNKDDAKRDWNAVLLLDGTPPVILKFAQEKLAALEHSKDEDTES